MKVIIKETGEDVSSLFLKQMKGEITREEFIELTGIKEDVEEIPLFKGTLEALDNLHI